jgi:transposase
VSKKRDSRVALTSSGLGQKKSYSEDFRRDAVRLVTHEKYTFQAAADAVNVCVQSLRAWYVKYVPAPAPCGEDATAQELREENQRLRKQLQRAELERDILKKATAYFAKESL